MGNLIYDERLMQYFLDGQPIPRISDFMNLIRDFSMVDPIDLDWKQKYGTALHYYLELVDRGEFDGGDERLYPHIESWVAFKKKYGFNLMEAKIEEINYHPKLLYAGRPDRRYYSEGKLRAVVEIKSSLPSKKTGIQLAAQAGMEITGSGRDVLLIEASFSRAGVIEKQEFKFAPNWNDFLCCYRVLKLKKGE